MTDRFTRWTPEANLALVAGSHAQVSFLQGTPRAEIKRLAEHPASAACAP